VKRLLGYSSIAHAGYLLLGVSALNLAGQVAVLYYLGGYLFTVLAAFTVIAVVLRHADTDDVSGLAGLNQRSPLLAAGMLFAMVSLAGIPPMAGFFGKFLLIKAALAQGPTYSGYYWLAAIAMVGVVISLYYYFGVVRVMYWSKDTPDLSAIRPPLPIRAAVWTCMAGMLFLGIYPAPLLNWATQAARVLQAP
jgi:NADH-quinone oxidoreductase subunit N